VYPVCGMLQHPANLSMFV